MDVAAYFRSITQEISAVQDRVSNLIDEQHQGEIGSWRESLVRSLLRRHLPATLGVGQGFVRTPLGVTSQLDVIVYDLNHPRLLHEGELVIVTSDAVRALVEVKSSTDGHQLREDLRKLAAAAYLCRQDPDDRVEQRHNTAGLFAGYFSLTALTQIQQRVLSEALRHSVLHHPSPLVVDERDPDFEASPRGHQLQCQRDDIKAMPDLAAINALALGPDTFIRHWGEGEERGHDQDLACWKKYHLPELAFGYFITNLIAAVRPHSIRRNRNHWWPAESKERWEQARIPYPQSKDFAEGWPLVKLRESQTQQ